MFGRGEVGRAVGDGLGEAVGAAVVGSTVGVAVGDGDTLLTLGAHDVNTTASSSDPIPLRLTF